MPVEFQHEIPPSSLREYDIRGIAGDTLRVEDAYAVGRSFGELLWRKDGRTAVVGRDGRLSSPELEAALIEGLRDSGISVTQIGLGPTPLLYFAGTVGNFDGALMVTGSHNPPTHNGFKMMRNGKPFFGAQIRELGDLANRGFSTRRPRGEFHRRDFSTAYIQELLKAFGSGRGLKVVWDNGNSAAGEILKRVVAALPGEHEILYPEIDGHFPHHHPDPTVENNLQDLIRRVRETQADIGIAFDGDADRIGVVDEEGKILWGDQILLFLAGDLLQRHPGSTVIADVKASDVFVKEITRLGGKPLIWKTGHSLIKNKMTETGALLAGEMSGHIFFRENWYGFDDALYGAIRILGILSRGQEPLSVFRKKLPKSWSTPELRFPIPEEEKFTLIETLKTHLSASGASFSDVDGVRVSDKDGWWLARASNTQPIIVGRMESASPEGLERLKKRFAEYLLQAGMGDLDFSAVAEGH